MSETNSRWTHFWDMNSGGGRKEQWSHIFIEAPEGEASSVFYSRFGHSPERVTCTCCGDDYSVSEHDSLAEASAYQRNCLFDREVGAYVERPDPTKASYSFGAYMTLDEYEASDDVLVIRATEITDAERTAGVPEQGYMWR